MASFLLISEYGFKFSFDTKLVSSSYKLKNRKKVFLVIVEDLNRYTVSTYLFIRDLNFMIDAGSGIE